MPAVPVLNIDEVANISQTPEESEIRYCHVFGIFLHEELTSNRLHWFLGDETCLRGIKIKLNGNADSYPRPKHGDIVRIHRLTFDRDFRLPMVAISKNVVVWTAFVMDPTPISTARHPTIVEGDITRRRILETFHCSTITRIKEIKTSPASDPSSIHCFDVAGLLEEKSSDAYGHIILRIKDGTGILEIRVFAKQREYDCADHFEAARELKLGDFIVVYGVKLAPKVTEKTRVNLSANKYEGRQIRVVEKGSILGVLLDQYLNPKPTNQPCSASQNSLEISRRRSPRLNSSQTSPVTDNNANITQNLVSVDDSPTKVKIMEQTTANEPPLPTYTKLSDIIMTGGKYQFYDIAGQVRGRPHETTLYGNWIFQLYDGTKPKYGSYFVEQVEEPVADCVCILVYSKQDPRDTDQHIVAVRSMNEGDLVFVRNVKVSFKEGRIKFEMNPNLAFGKSIDVIDKESRFGSYLMDIVTNPDVDELREDFLSSSPTGSDFVVVDD